MSAAPLAKSLRKWLRAIFDKLKLLRIAGCAAQRSVVNKWGEMRYRWIQLTTRGIFEALKMVEDTERDAFSRLDSAGNTPFDAFVRLKEGGG